MRLASNIDDPDRRLNFDVDFTRSFRRRALPCKPSRSIGNPLAAANSATDIGISRIARTLALAHQIEQAVLDGRASDYRVLARQMTISPPRIGQIVGLTQLAPAIQERILLDETGALASISPRNVERIAEVVDWHVQTRRFEKLASNAYPGRRIRRISS